MCASCAFQNPPKLPRFLIATGYAYHRMDGGTPVRARMQLMDDFNESPRTFAFLLTTKVGGIGVNLTGANRYMRTGIVSFPNRPARPDEVGWGSTPAHESMPVFESWWRRRQPRQRQQMPAAAESALAAGLASPAHARLSCLPQEGLQMAAMSTGRPCSDSGESPMCLPMRGTGC